MKIYFAIAITLYFASCTTTKNAEQQYFESVKKQHKTLAILPAVVYLNAGENQNFNQAELNEASLKLGFIIQNGLFEKLKNKKNNITIQDIKISNDKLFSTGISFEQFKTMRMDTLAKLLGVDVVIYTNTDLSKISQKNITGWIGIGSSGAVITGIALTVVSAATAKESYEDKIEVSYNIIEPATNKILWQQKYNTFGMTNGGVEGFFRNSIKQAAKKLPY